MKSIVSLLICIALFTSIFAQEADYQTRKEQALAKPSPFEQIVKRELPATIEYEDDEIISFLPLRLQAPVHILIVPKKRIPTMNDLDPQDVPLVGRMFDVARKLAKEKGIGESGYRLSINTNEDSGQSVFHIHLHLLGGKKLGPMVEQ